MSDFATALRETMERCAATKEIIGASLHEDDLESFVAGYVRSHDDESYSLLLIDPDGMEDGIHVGRLEDVEQFHVDTDYLRRLKLLHENIDRIYQFRPAAHEYGVNELWLDALREAANERMIVTIIDVNGAKERGFVRSVGDDFVELESLAEDYGIKDGIYFIRAEHIERVTIGSRRDQALLFAHKMRYEI
jgi:hypothetical protein